MSQHDVVNGAPYWSAIQNAVSYLGATGHPMVAEAIMGMTGDLQHQLRRCKPRDEQRASEIRTRIVLLAQEVSSLATAMQQTPIGRATDASIDSVRSELRENGR